MGKHSRIKEGDKVQVTCGGNYGGLVGTVMQRDDTPGEYDCDVHFNMFNTSPDVVAWFWHWELEIVSTPCLS